MTGVQTCALPIWVSAEACDKVYAIADEDMDRETEEKTSAVHFMRFQLTPEIINAISNGAMIAVGIDHENYNVELKAIPAATRESLAGDLN